MSIITINVDLPNTGQGDPLRNAFIAVNTMFAELYDQKVNKISGRGLSENNFSTILQTKLNNIASGAEVNVQSNLQEQDETQDSFVLGQEVFFSLERTPARIEIFSGVSIFQIQLGLTVDRVLLNRAELYEIDEWSQTGTTLTITKTMFAGNRIQINFF